MVTSLNLFKILLNEREGSSQIGFYGRDMDFMSRGIFTFAHIRRLKLHILLVNAKHAEGLKYIHEDVQNAPCSQI